MQGERGPGGPSALHLSAELEMGEDEEEEEEAKRKQIRTVFPHFHARSPRRPPPRHDPPPSSQRCLSAVSQGEALSRSDSSGTTNQVRRFRKAMCSDLFFTVYGFRCILVFI